MGRATTGTRRRDRGPTSTSRGRVKYDAIADAYNRRYELHDYPGIRSAILEIVAMTDSPRVLEVGCGTGRWLHLLALAGCQIAGIDPSREMLLRVPFEARGDVRCGVAEALPWPKDCFDVVLYINALQHFTDPETALRETSRVLRPGGRFLSIGLDPHERRDRWFVYDFFPETLALDLERFPSRSRRAAWIEAAGLTNVIVRPVEFFRSSKSFKEAVRAGALEQSFTSQLTALSSAEYSAGMMRIRETAQRQNGFRLISDLVLYATEATKPA